MATTKIEWCNATWNPIAGCTKVSAGCENCWAINIARRLQAKRIEGYEGVTDKNGWTEKINLIRSKLFEPICWRKPRCVFVCSRCDLFHPKVPNSFIYQIYDVMMTMPRHIFIVLTKRPERMRLVLQRLQVYTSVLEGQPWKNGLPNVWHLVTCENQEMADKRIPELLRLRELGDWPMLGISAEPLLGRIELPGDLDYVIVGGESGSHARPCDVDAIRSIIKQCKDTNTPCFVKQLGAKPFSSKLCMEIKLNHRKGADPAEWPEDLRVREFPK